MVKKSDIYEEKGSNLASKVPDWVAHEFRTQAKETPGQNVKSNLACAAQLWISIPPEIQSHLLQSMKHKNLYEILTRKMSSNAAKGFADLPEDVQKALLVVQEYAKSEK